MKAKEYHERYQRQVNEGQDPVEALTDIVLDFLHETGVIQDERKAITDSAYAAILREQSEKWRAFARLVGPAAKPEGFYATVLYALQDKPDLIGILQANGFTR